MRLPRFHHGAILAGLLALASAPALATTVMQFNLAEMTDRADRIFRGRILSATEGTVDVGGGQLPIVTYRVQVDEAFLGDVTTVKGVRIAEIRMLGKVASIRHGNLRRVSPLPEMPQLRVGQTYLLFATRPSAIGLSTTVGLGQGFFAISSVGKDEVALNGANNSGLFRGMDAGAPAARAARTAAAPDSGAVAYVELASRVRALVASRGAR